MRVHIACDLPTYSSRCVCVVQTTTLCPLEKPALQLFASQKMSVLLSGCVAPNIVRVHDVFFCGRILIRKTYRVLAMKAKTPFPTKIHLFF